MITAETHELEERVIFSEATGLLRERVPVRVELYPGYVPRSVTGIGEERSAIEELQLSVVDRAERLAQEGYKKITYIGDAGRLRERLLSSL